MPGDGCGCRPRDAAGTHPKTCPSSTCSEGSLLLGIMTPRGTLAYLRPPMPIDAEFVERETAVGNPERRFRFAGTCVEGACPQWTGGGCAIADLAADSAPAEPHAVDSLPACSIRHSCRWFSQRGAAACSVCPLIVADMGGVETYRSRPA